MKGEADILLGIVYRPPSENVEWLECFDSQLEAATKSNLELAIFGDFNIDLLNGNNSNHKSTQITQLYGLTQVINMPTGVTHNTETLLDTVTIKILIFPCSSMICLILYLTSIYSETPLIRTLMGLENSVLNRWVSLLEGFILTEIKALVTESAVLIRGVSC